MASDARSPAGRHLTSNPLDYSSNNNVSLNGKSFDIGAAADHNAEYFGGNNDDIDEQAYDIGAAADHNAEYFRGNNDDIDEQAYDIGAAADYNTDLLKRKNDESYELASPAFFNTTPLSTSYTATLVSEAQDHTSVDFNSGNWNESSPAEPNVEVSMAGSIEAGNTTKQFPPTPYVNDEEISSQIATAPLALPSPQRLSGTTDGSHEVPLIGVNGRLICPRPGCNKTFKRNFELTRHINTIHDPSIQVVCPVYGCKRTSTPFNRADKFMEHFRKHDSSRTYRCLMNNNIIKDIGIATLDVLDIANMEKRLANPPHLTSQDYVII